MRVVPTAENPSEEERRKADQYTDLLREILGSEESAKDYLERWRVVERDGDDV